MGIKPSAVFSFTFCMDFHFKGVWAQNWFCNFYEEAVILLCFSSSGVVDFWNINRIGNKQ